MPYDKSANVKNRCLKAWLDEYAGIYDEYLGQLRSAGIRLGEPHSDDDRVTELLDRLHAKGALFRNGGASVSVNGLSTACEACTGAPGSRTFFISLKCPRNCYFCFNPNQEGYEHFLEHDRDWRSEFDELELEGRKMTHIALTGGEPLLHFEKTLSFFHEAHRRWPEAHLRLYTAGDDLTRESLDRLVGKGLSEIRFSVKLDDGERAYARTLDTVRMACGFESLDVMVEMPVIPGTVDRMKELMLKLDQMGAFGINLLEFCFPLNNWSEFERRGFAVKNPPFPVLYDYGYAGALPIAGSEAECLELLEFAIDEGLRLGVHYCSLENKHRDQILTQNRMARVAHPAYAFDPGDFFLKTLKAFGSDAVFARQLLRASGEKAWVYEDEDGCLSAHPRLRSVLEGYGVEFAASFNVLEERDGGVFLRELDLALPLAPIPEALGADSLRLGR